MPATHANNPITSATLQKDRCAMIVSEEDGWMEDNERAEDIDNELYWSDHVNLLSHSLPVVFCAVTSHQEAEKDNQNFWSFRPTGRPTAGV